MLCKFCLEEPGTQQVYIMKILRISESVIFCNKEIISLIKSKHKCTVSVGPIVSITKSYGKCFNEVLFKN